MRKGWLRLLSIDSSRSTRSVRVKCEELSDFIEKNKFFAHQHENVDAYLAYRHQCNAVVQNSFYASVQVHCRPVTTNSFP